MSDRKFYKVVCDEVGLLLLVRQLTMEEEKTEYYAIKKKIGSLKKPISIESYQTFILNKFLHKPDEFFANLPEDEDKFTIIKAVYQSIIEAYPPFDLLFVCADLNNGSLIEDIQEHLGDLFTKAGITEGAKKVPSPKAINTLDDLKSLERYLSKNLIGQEEAVDGVVDNVKLIASGLYKNSSFFFIGPTGVGKTELARLLGNKYSGNFWKVNCAEYASAHEYAKLIGSPPGYVGHTDSSVMAEKAEKSNRWVILFDEIEKAHHKFYDFLLSLLDDGSCTDNMGRVLDFSESIFIFTSNQGISDFGGRKVGFDKAVVSLSGCKEEIKESVKKKFPAEFMNRIDNYVFFNTLGKDHVRKIATLALRGIPIKKYKALLDFIVENGYSEEYGARNIKRFIKNEVATKVAQKLLERRLPKKRGDMYTPKIIKGELHIIDLKEEKTLDQSAE
jgi:MoxR-like ATPase